MHLEVELHLGHRAVGQRHAAVRGARLDADLGEARRPRRPRIELASVAVEVRPELLLGRVLLAHLADLAADADRDAVGLERADQGGQLGRADVVLALLLVDGRLGEIDERRGVDVDVPVAGVDRQPAGPPDLLGRAFRVVGVLLGVELVVVALDEDGALPAGGDRPGEDGRRVVDRALEGVRLLAPGELEDHGPDVRRRRGLVDRPGHVEHLRPEVEGGHREPVDLAAGTRHVQLVDARGSRPERLGGLVDQPAGDVDRRAFLGERCRPGEVADDLAAEGRRVVDDEPLAVDVG